MSLKSDYAARFRSEVCEGASCFFEGRDKGVCDGPLDCAHLIPAQRIRAHVSTLAEEDRARAVYDPRAAVAMCRRHHHLLDNGFVRLYLEDLPSALFAYAKEWGLGWSLERDYPSLEELRGVV